MDKDPDIKAVEEIEKLYGSLGYDEKFLSCQSIKKYDLKQMFRQLQDIFDIFNDGIDAFINIPHSSIYVRVMCCHPITKKYYVEFMARYKNEDTKYYIRKMNCSSVTNIPQIKDDDKDMIELNVQKFQNAINQLLLYGAISHYESSVEFN